MPKTSLRLYISSRFVEQTLKVEATLGAGRLEMPGGLVQLITGLYSLREELAPCHIVKTN